MATIRGWKCTLNSSSAEESPCRTRSAKSCQRFVSLLPATFTAGKASPDGNFEWERSRQNLTQPEAQRVPQIPCPEFPATFCAVPPHRNKNILQPCGRDHRGR